MQSFSGTPGTDQLPRIIYSKLSYQQQFEGERETLLRQAFAMQSQIKIEEPLSGYSGAQTWRVSTDRGQVYVIKLAHPTIIEREYQNHQMYVANALHSNAAHPQGRPLVSESGRWALLKSTFVRLRQSRTLLEHIERRGARDISGILNDIFREHGYLWWQSALRKPINCGVYYDRLLPEHLRLVAFEGSDTDAEILRAGQVTLDNINHLEAGIIHGNRPNVYLQDFLVEKQKDGVATLYADSPSNVESPRIRIKLANAPNLIPGSHISLYAKNLISRRELLNEIARRLLPRFSADADTFVVDTIEYPNPFPFLHTLLEKNYDARVSIIHGDLNLRNVLIDLDEQNQRYKQHWLIDFEKTGEGPVLFDLQWLEVQVIFWLLAPAIKRSRLHVNVIVDVLNALHRFEELPAQLQSPLQVPYHFLIEIRRLVSDFLAIPNDWSEYYRGLVIALIGALRYEEFDHFSQQVALLSAASSLRHTAILPGALERLPALQFQNKNSKPQNTLNPLTGNMVSQKSAPYVPRVEPPPRQAIKSDSHYALETKAAKKPAHFAWRRLWLGIAVCLLLLFAGWAGNLYINQNRQPVVSVMAALNGSSEDAAAALLQGRKLVVAASVESGPFSYRKDDQFHGFEVDLVREMARRWYKLPAAADPEAQGLLSFHEVYVTEREKTLRENHTIDFLIGAVSYSEQRCLQDLLCTRTSHFSENQGLLVQRNGPITRYCDPVLDSPKTYVTVLSKTSAASASTLADFKSECGFSADLKIEERSTRQEAFAAVKDNPWKIYKTDRDILQFYVKEYGYQELLNVLPADERSKVDLYKFWLPASNTGLKDLIDRTMADLISDGTFQRVCQEYFPATEASCNP